MWTRSGRKCCGAWASRRRSCPRSYSTMRAARREPVAYVPIDIAREQLAQTTTALRAAYPQMDILPVCADYTRPHALPTPTRPAPRRVAYFPGSTIGNFDPAGAQDFLHHLAALCGPGGAALIGVDLPNDPLLLHAAYNDREGVTAAFNQNVLTRLNRELGGGCGLHGRTGLDGSTPALQRAVSRRAVSCPFGTHASPGHGPRSA